MFPQEGIATGRRGRHILVNPGPSAQVSAAVFRLYSKFQSYQYLEMNLPQSTAIIRRVAIRGDRPETPGRSSPRLCVTLPAVSIGRGGMLRGNNGESVHTPRRKTRPTLCRRVDWVLPLRAECQRRAGRTRYGARTPARTVQPGQATWPRPVRDRLTDRRDPPVVSRSGTHRHRSTPRYSPVARVACCRLLPPSLHPTVGSQRIGNRRGRLTGWRTTPNDAVWHEPVRGRSPFIRGSNQDGF